MKKKKDNFDIKAFGSGLYMGLLISVLIYGSTTIYKKVTKSPKLKVGECISNGLYIEEVVRIEDGRYITVGHLSSGKQTLPDDSDFWLIEQNPKVNCVTGELINEEK